jgi:Tfp pilus assembly protein PilV
VRRGLTLMEVVIAGFLFLCVSLAMFAVLSGSLRLGHNAELRLQAKYHASWALEEARARKPSELEVGRVVSQLGEFERTVQVREVSGFSGSSLKEVVVVVRWKDGETPMSLTRVLRVCGVED